MPLQFSVLSEPCLLYTSIGEYDSLLSKTAEGSDIYRINHADGSPVEVDARTAELLSIALSYASLSDGLVDPTIGTLSDLWLSLIHI